MPCRRCSCMCWISASVSLKGGLGSERLNADHCVVQSCLDLFGLSAMVLEFDGPGRCMFVPDVQGHSVQHEAGVGILVAKGSADARSAY